MRSFFSEQKLGGGHNILSVCSKYLKLGHNPWIIDAWAFILAYMFPVTSHLDLIHEESLRFLPSLRWNLLTVQSDSASLKFQNLLEI